MADEPAPGPLDPLLERARQPRPALPKTPVHGRVLTLEEPDGTAAWVLSCFADPGGARALHAALRPRVEAALLAELSRPAKELREDGRRYVALRLALFPEVTGAAAAVEAFGLRPASSRGAPFRRAIAHLRQEARSLGAEVADEPASVWEAPMVEAPEASALEERLRAGGGDEAWGVTPGAPAARLSAALSATGRDPIEPGLGALDALEAILVPRRTEVIRWIPPMLFQALCDLVGLAVERDLAVRTEWAVCAPEDDGLAPPPLLRVAGGQGFLHIPVGLELLRWCVMPARPGEIIPPLSEWVRGVFR